MNDAFHYSMKARHLKQQKENQKSTRNIGTDMVMRQPTNQFGLYDKYIGTKSKVIRTSEYDTNRQVLNSSDEVRHATKNLNTNLYKSRNRHIDNKNKRQF